MMHLEYVDIIPVWRIFRGFKCRCQARPWYYCRQSSSCLHRVWQADFTFACNKFIPNNSRRCL